MERSVASSAEDHWAIAALRRAEPPDAIALRDLMQNAYGLYLPRMDRPPAPMLQDYHPVIAAGLIHVLDGETGLDAAIVGEAQRDHMMVETVAVSRSQQGNGIGRALMAWAERQARLRNLTVIRLYTNAVMVENIPFYQGLGYRITHRGQDQGYQRIYFEKHLPAV
ncbi:MAG: GNAT family N-acetyltransferase [Pseudomonadota bacterium]